MTPEQERMILSLIETPGRIDPSTPEEVLQAFGHTDGQALAVELLDAAVERKDGDEVELSLILSFVFGVSKAQLRSLVHLSYANWHWSHEDVVAALEELDTPAAVDALFHATQWVPQNLVYDESRALAVKAIWALGRLRGAAAGSALSRLLHSDNEILREEAQRQVKRRRHARS